MGGTSGIGAALAQYLHTAGAVVTTASRQSAPDLPWKHLIFEATDPDTTALTALPSPLHGLVYCPGSITLKPFHRLTPDDFRRDFELNVIGAVQTIQAVLPGLKAAGGASIVLFSTVAARSGMGFHASIATAKAGVEGLTVALAAELATSGIRVNALAPSLTDTPLAASLLATDEKRAAAAKRHPLGRVGTPEEVAQLAAVLLSTAGGWVTGQVWATDGGLSTLRTL